MVEPIISASHPSEDFQIIDHNQTSLNKIAYSKADVISGEITHYTLSLKNEEVEAEKFLYALQKNNVNISVSSLTWVGKSDKTNIVELTYATRHNFTDKGYANQIVKIALNETGKILMKRGLSEIWLIAKVKENNVASLEIAKRIFQLNAVKVIDPFNNTETLQFEKLFRGDELVFI